MKNKIPINKVSNKCFVQKGFNNIGCYGCACTDLCCKYGADIDKESYELIIKNKEFIEPKIKIKIEKCFEKDWSNDSEYLGKNMIRSKKAKNGYCVFHNTLGKGCILYGLAGQKKISKRIVPSICRLFPLTWHKGKLIVYGEQKNSKIPGKCNCLDKNNITTKNIFVTQKKEIMDIFKIIERKD